VPLLGLLNTFIRLYPSHAHHVLSTNLLDVLILAGLLERDTGSVTYVAICSIFLICLFSLYFSSPFIWDRLALSSLTMLLPRVPTSAGPHLQSLFAVYARVVTWPSQAAADSMQSTESAASVSDSESEHVDAEASHGWVSLGKRTEIFTNEKLVVTDGCR
jgi:hypothetical protein